MIQRVSIVLLLTFCACVCLAGPPAPQLVITNHPVPPWITNRPPVTPKTNLLILHSPTNYAVQLDQVTAGAGAWSALPTNNFTLPRASATQAMIRARTVARWTTLLWTNHGAYDRIEVYRKISDISGDATKFGLWESNSGVNVYLLVAVVGTNRSQVSNLGTITNTLQPVTLQIFPK